jgi:hypothetical protein
VHRPVRSFALGIVIVLLSGSALIALAPTVAAQSTNTSTTTSSYPPPPAGWHDQAGDLGDAQALYQDTIAGHARPFVAKFFITNYFKNDGVVYFLFALDLQRTPLVGNINQLIDTSTGKPLPIYRTEVQQNGAVIQWWVDIANMPPPGTEIDFQATVGSTGPGEFPAGAFVMPFDYHYQQINSYSGTPEQLYIFTQYTVNGATQSGCAGALCNLAQAVHSPVPGPDFIATIAAVGVATALAVALRKSR